MQPSDEQLVALAAKPGGRQAFATLVSRHQSELRGLMRRFTNGDLQRADDLAQEAFINAYRYITKFRGESSFRTWLYRIAYRVFLSDIRRELPDTEEYVDEQFKSAELADSRDFLTDYAIALGQLAPPQRVAVDLALSRGFSHPEIARIMSLPLGTVKSHVLRGRERLQQLLGDWREGFEHD